MFQEYLREMESVRLKAGLRLAMKASNMANSFFQSQEPWAKIKAGEAECGECAAAINLCCQALRLIAALLGPFMPSVSEAIERQGAFTVCCRILRFFTFFKIAICNFRRFLDTWNF